MSLQVIENPIHDPRWSNVVMRHPAASVFHTPAWLEALRRTYGYVPIVLTTSRSIELDNAIVACRVGGWTRQRLVSLPFSDHCDALVSGVSELRELAHAIVRSARERGWGTIELRLRSHEAGEALASTELGASQTYSLHEIDLRPELSDIFARFHPSSTQRAIRRAEREGVAIDAGRSDTFLTAFYGLMRMTRRRHGLPPQPLAWYRNLRDTMGDSLAVHVASHRGRAIAAMITLSSKTTTYYKYGGSDAAHHRLSAMPALFWHVVQASRTVGHTKVDLGRSDLDQPGLLAFKDHLGARRSGLTYYRHPAGSEASSSHSGLRRATGRILSVLPDFALDFAGRVLYRHLG